MSGRRQAAWAPCPASPQTRLEASPVQCMEGVWSERSGWTMPSRGQAAHTPGPHTWKLMGTSLDRDEGGGWPVLHGPLPKIVCVHSRFRRRYAGTTVGFMAMRREGLRCGGPAKKSCRAPPVTAHSPSSRVSQPAKGTHSPNQQLRCVGGAWARVQQARQALSPCPNEC